MPPTVRLKQLEERKRYEPAEAEARVWRRWEEAGAFRPELEGDGAEETDASELLDELEEGQD